VLPQWWDGSEVTWLVKDRNRVIVWRRIFVDLNSLTYVVMSFRNTYSGLAHVMSPTMFVHVVTSVVWDALSLVRLNLCLRSAPQTLCRWLQWAADGNSSMLIIDINSPVRLRCSRMWGRRPRGKLFVGYGALRCIHKIFCGMWGTCCLALPPKFFHSSSGPQISVWAAQRCWQHFSNLIDFGNMRCDWRIDSKFMTRRD
jgi:hypothetical protein